MARSAAEPANLALAVLDIFRVAGGMLAEHRDAIPDVPAVPINPLSMF
jgi:predicted SnoaL-like aldol condensation-catalyzing enzyme